MFFLKSCILILQVPALFDKPGREPMIVVFKMADLPVNVQKWKLSYFQATYKYANCVQFMLYIAMYLNYIVLSQQYCAIWVIFVTKWTLGLHFICTKKSPSPWKNTTFVFNRTIRHFPDLRVTQDFLCIEPEVLPTTYKKISIVTKWGFFVTKFFGGVLGP